SGGLFDYFKEKHFIYLVRKYLTFLAENGEMIIGNFSRRNPSRKMMEVLSDWYLNYRTEYDLIRMAIEAGADEDHIKVDHEPLGVNLFLTIRNPV
ncbi:MAG: hypothetical protein JSV24_02330, partial [Bacteroidales bacterium]